MPAVTHPLNRFISEYGRAVLLALLVHALILLLLLTIRYSQPVQLPLAEPITSFLYQPPLPVVPPAMQQAADALPPEMKITEQIATEAPPLLATTSNASIEYPPTTPALQIATETSNEQDTTADKQAIMTVTGENLAQRALKRVAKPEPTAIEQDATASYQQFLQQQQQPRLTVYKKP